MSGLFSVIPLSLLFGLVYNPGFGASNSLEPGSQITVLTGLGGLPSSTGPAFWPWNVSIVFVNESFKGQKVLSQHPNLHLLVIEGMGT
jgi:hypothetical protein